MNAHAVFDARSGINAALLSLVGRANARYNFGILYDAGGGGVLTLVESTSPLRGYLGVLVR